MAKNRRAEQRRAERAAVSGQAGTEAGAKAGAKEGTVAMRPYPHEAAVAGPSRVEQLLGATLRF